MTSVDLFRLEQLGETQLSPNGRMLAYVVRRPKESARYGLQLLDHDSDDIRVFSLEKDTSEKITDGAADGSGFWAPRWSPNGERLAMFSTRGGNVRLWIWTRSSRKLQMVSGRGVYDAWREVWAWVSDHELVFPALPAGKAAWPMTMDTQIAETAPKEWEKTWKGKEPAVSALVSGTEPSMEGRPQSEMLLVDAITGQTRVLSAAPGFSRVSVSPNRLRVAFLKQVGVWHPLAGHPVRPWLNPARYQLVVATLGSQAPTLVMNGVRDAVWGSVLWSPDGEELAVVGHDETSSSDRVPLFRCAVATGTCKPSRGANVDVPTQVNFIYTNPSYFWFGKHDLLMRGTSEQPLPSPEAQGASRWFAIDDDGNSHEFAPGLGQVPSVLLPEPGMDGLIGLIRGSLWQIGRDGRAIKDLTPQLKGGVTSIERSEQPVGAPVILGVGQGETKKLYRLDLNSSQFTELIKPASDAKLVGYDSETGTSVFSANNRTGTYLWVADPQRTHLVLETNGFLEGIEEGELRKIQYRSLEGKDLSGWLILPPQYKKGRKYPVIVWVYLGQMFGDDPPSSWAIHINSANELNLQLLAAHGFVVLLPSMPFDSNYRARDMKEPFFELSKGVLPAVDKLIELEIADGNKIGVMGISFGGYSTEGLIAQTNRFRAAVALCAPSDWVSWYGTFDARQRYEPFVHEDLLRMWNPESLGVPPWEDLNLYLRNSPISYAGRIDTPLMMIHGDLDSIPIQQAEELFTALYRQNKRATLVRYWGEEHGLSSPANISDMWQRIYGWFDKLIPADTN